MTKTQAIALLVLIVIALSSPLLASEEFYVEVEGAAMITGGNLVRARDLAIRDGLRNAVEYAVGIALDSQTRVRNYQVIEDSILTNSQGYISSYDVLDSWISQDIFYVRLGAVVMEKLIVDKLDDIIRDAGDPRVMVIIPEVHIQRFIPDPAAETEIIRQLLEAGFRLVDQGQLSRVRDSETLRRALAGDTNAYQRLSAEYDADILVIGEAFSELVGTYHGFFSCRARVEVRVVRADTGEILAAHGIHESGVDITESAASKKSLAEAGASMAKYLLEVLPKRLSHAHRSLQITLSGVSFIEAQRFIDEVKGMHLVDDIFLRDFVGGRARIDIKTSLLPLQLAQEIIEWIDMPLEILALSGSKIEIKIN